MAKSQEEILRMIHRIKTSPDGPELIEYLHDLSADNYKAFKKAHMDANEFHKGYAFSIDNLITLFEECDSKLNEKPPTVPDWTN